MPQYFSGADRSLAFSQGLMAGYDFIDRIKARKEALELQRQENARADRRMTLAENADERAAAAEGRAASEYTHGVARREVIEGREDRDDAFAVDERNRLVRVRGETEATSEELARMQLQGAQRGSLASVGAAGAAPRSAGSPQATQPPPPPSSVAPEAQSAGPVDLRAAQLERDNAPNIFERAGAAVSGFLKESRDTQDILDTVGAWKAVANPGDNSVPKYFVTDSPGKKYVSSADIRRDPTPFAFRYAQDRAKLPSQTRASLDLTMGNALAERKTQIAGQIQALDSRDPANAGQIRKLTNELIAVGRNADDISKKIVETAAVDAGITRAVKPSDTRVAPAIVDAAAKANAVQGPPRVSNDELRALNTTVPRATGASRLSSKNIETLVKAARLGLVTPEQIHNWSKYGTPIAPKSPTLHAIGNGTAVLMGEDGPVGFVQAPGTGAAASGLKANELRLRQEDNINAMYNAIEGAVKAGKIEGEPKQLFNDMMVTLGRSAGDIQNSRGVRMLDGDGSVQFGMMSRPEASTLVDGFVKYYNGEVDTPWLQFGPAGKPFQDYLPESPSHFVPGMTIDGFTHDGVGDPNDPNSWVPQQ